jgi:hypothetical protein
MSFLNYLPPAVTSSLMTAQIMIQSSLPQSLKVHDVKVTSNPRNGADAEFVLELSHGNEEPFETSFSVVEGEQPRFLPTLETRLLLQSRMRANDKIGLVVGLAQGGFPGLALTGPFWCAAMCAKIGLEVVHENYGPVRSLLKGLALYLHEDELELFACASQNMWREDWSQLRSYSSRHIEEKISDSLLIIAISHGPWEKDGYIWIDRKGDTVAVGEKRSDGEIDIRSRFYQMRVTESQVKHLTRTHRVIDLPQDEAKLRLFRMKANPSRYF